MVLRYLRRLLSLLPLDPNSRAVVIWDSLNVAAIHISYFFVLFHASIDASLQFHLLSIYYLDLLYLLYFFTQFFVSYKDNKGKAVRNYKAIAKRVLKTIALDLLSLFPFEVFGQNSERGRYLRLNRIVRFFRVFKFLNRMESNIMTSSLFWASIKGVSATILSMHLWCCIWYFIACENILYGGSCFSSTWASSVNRDYGINISETGPYQRYLVTYYWSITTITTVGYGDIHPQNWRERLVALSCMIVELTKLSVILGNITALLTYKEGKVSAFKYHLNAVQEHMLNMTLPEELRKRVMDWYEHMWKQNRGEEVEKLLLMLPQNLQTALVTEAHQGMLTAIAIQCMQSNRIQYLRQLSQMIVPTIYLPGDVILKKGEFGEKLLFLRKGHLEVINGTGQIKHLIQPGDSFGRINLLYKTISTLTLRAGSLCELAILPASNFSTLEKYYPIIGLQLRTALKTQLDGSCANTKETCKPPENAEEEGIYENLSEKHQISNQKNAMQRFIRKCINITITPGSRFHVIWNAFMFIIILTTLWVFSYLAAFTRFKPSIDYEHNRAEFAFTYVIDLIFIADMVVSMKLTYEGADAIIIDKPWSVFKHYVWSRKFILDVLAVLPTEVFSLAFNDSWSYVAILKLNRILKWWRLWQIVEGNLAQSIRVSSIKVHFLRMLVYIPTITHVMACTWFVLACFHEGRCLEDSWAQQQGITINNSALHDYIVSLYWSTTTMTTVGYGDIVPYNDRDRILAIIAMKVGTLFYVYILGALAATLISVFASKVTFQQRLGIVKDFVAQHTGNNSLSKRIHAHYNLLWKQSRGESNYIAVLLSSLPESLREEVLLSDLQEIIENIPWFTQADPRFLKKLASIMTLYQYSPGDFIMCHGDIYNEMYCVRKGVVEVLSEDLSHVVTKIGLGGYFGELCLLGKSQSIITARAATPCEVLGIDRVELETILKEFPPLQSQFRKLAQEYQDNSIAEKMAVFTSRKIKIPPREFVKPNVFSALAISMVVPVNIVTRRSILPKIVAGFTDSRIRRSFACPLSIVTYPEDVTFLKYEPTADEVLTLDEIGITLKNEKQAQLMRVLSNRKRESQAEAIAVDYKRSSMSANTGTNQGVETACHNQCLGTIKQYAESFYSRVKLPIPEPVLYTIYTLTFPFDLRYVLLPKSKSSVIWELLICVLGLISCLTISLQGSFFISSPLLWTVNYIIDVFFYIDMFLKLYTAYFNAEGILVTAPIKCTVNYFRTNFLLDLISNFPTELFSLAIWNGDNLLLMLSLIRLNRLVRVYKLVVLFDYLEDHMSLLTNYYKVIKFFILLAIGTHWIACYWFLLGCSNLTGDATEQIDGKDECTIDGWALQESALTPFDSNHSTYKRYVTTLYWASISSTTVGYGDIIPYTDFERLYAMLIMVVSVISYGYMLGSFAASLTNAGFTYNAFKQKVSDIKVYLKDNKVDSSLVGDVIKYYEYLWQKKKGVELQYVFEGLPVSLKADLAHNLHRDFIEKISIFKNVDATFIKLVALACQPVFYLSDQCILKKGDLGNAMYFISKGEVQILSGKDDSVLIAEVGAGNFFGEISCLFGCLITATVKAKTNCDLLMLSKEDLKYCLRHYPEIEEQIVATAQQRKNVVQTTEHSEVPAHSRVHDNSNQSRSDEKRCNRSFFYQRIIIDPESYVGITVSAIGYILVLFTSLMLPYQATFVDTTTGLYVITYLAELYFVIEVILKFFTIKYDKDAHKITESKKIAIMYLKKPNGFLHDIVLLMPFEIFAFTISSRHTRTVTILWLRTHRMIRVFRLAPFIKAQYHQQFRALMSIHFVAIAIQCGLLLTFSTHWCACLWYLIACPGAECNSGTWAYSAGLANSSSYHYLTSLYWSVTTLTTVGYGEISATNTLEMIISSIIMVMGKLIFGFILGSVASEISNWGMTKLEFEGKVAAIRKYMVKKKISPSFRAHVLEYLQYVWARKRSVHYRTLLNDMPFCMQAEIAMAGTENFLRKVPLFQDIDTAFLRRLSLTLDKFFYLPNQFIVVTRDIDYDLYIIQEGNVRVYTEGSGDQVTLSSGGYFGLNSFYNKNQKEVTAIAVDHVDMIIVHKSEFDQLVKVYPNAQEHLNSILECYGSLPCFGEGMDVLETTV